MQGRTNCLSLHGDVPQRVAIGLVPKHVPPGKIKTIASVPITLNFIVSSREGLLQKDLIQGVTAQASLPSLIHID